VVQRPQATSRELNDVAWFRLEDGGDLDTALALAHKAVQTAGPGDAHPARNTLAAIEAELGDVDRAVEDNWKAMALLPSNEPTDADWYVAARIDEAIGRTADAIAIYARIAVPGDGRLTANELASRRLAALRRIHQAGGGPAVTPRQ
jgi:tetratricopeptide (TPR) repeat protein